MAHAINETDCIICSEKPANQCSRINCCSHLMCMECAVKIAIGRGGPRCPQCRQGFDTITQYDGGFVVKLTSNTLYLMSANGTLMPFLNLSDLEMHIASRIRPSKESDENGSKRIHFYLPMVLRDALGAIGRTLVVTSADDGPGRAITRSDADRFWYDQDEYIDELQNLKG